MKRGFTLLELIIVIIIIGILATLGFTQYARMMEKSRGAEAKMVCGTIRTMAAGYKLETGNTTGWSNTSAGIGSTGTDQIPGPLATNCATRNYFWYIIEPVGPDNITIIATRCTSGGKPPNIATASQNLTLTSNLTSGVDIWTGFY